MYRIVNVDINGIIPILIFILNTYVILNVKTNAIKSNITRLKYNPLLSNILYRQNIANNVNRINIITIISSICAITISSPILFTVTGLIAGFGAITDYFDGKSSNAKIHRKYLAYIDYLKKIMLRSPQKPIRSPQKPICSPQINWI